MIDPSGEADAIKNDLCREFNARLDTLCSHTCVASGNSAVALDIQEAWLNLLAALDGCKRVF